MATPPTCYDTSGFEASDVGDLQGSVSHVVVPFCTSWQDNADSSHMCTQPLRSQGWGRRVCMKLHRRAILLVSQKGRNKREDLKIGE